MPASNTGRKVPASSPPETTTNSASSGTVKLKKSTAKVAEPSDSPIVGTSQNSESATKPPGSPSSTSGDTILCKHCKKQIPKDLHPSHSKPCLRAKQEQKRKKKDAQEKAAAKEAVGGDTIKVDADKTEEAISKPVVLKVDTPEEPNSTSKNNKKSSLLDPTANVTASTKKPNKKRKAVDEGASVNGDALTESKPPTKKQKKKVTSSAAAADTSTVTTTGTAGAAASTGTPTTTTAAGAGASSSTATAATASATTKPKPGGKPKGPVDVEKQCGVLLPNGAMCARSLTCKSHAMGAKRAVPGRSLPYDVLLQQYQKKNQAKLHKAALASGAPLPEDGLDGAAGPVDSDEERDAVMAGILRAAPRPLAERAVVSVRQRTQAVRMREMLSQALAGNRGGGLFAVGPRRGIVGIGQAGSGNTSAVPGMDGSEGGGWAMGDEGAGGATAAAMAAAAGRGAAQPVVTAAAAASVAVS